MIINKNRNIAIIVSAVAVIVCTVWIITDKTVNRAGTIVGILSLALFALILINLIIRWHEEWFSHNWIAKENDITPISLKIYFIIFLLFIILGVAELIIIHEIRVLVFHDTTTFFKGLELFYHIDTGYYIEIAENWYTNLPDKIFCLVFYPAYPIAIRVINCITGNSLISGIVVSLLLYAVNACLLMKLLAMDFSGAQSRRGVKYFAILPGAFFFVAPMSESLFFFFSLITIILARNDRWFFADLTGALCAFTRSLGVLIFIPLIYHCITMAINDSDNRKKWIIRGAACFVIPLGTVAYLAINYSVTGNAFAFSALEKEKWNQSLGLFFDTIAFQIDNGLADIQQPYYTNALGLWFPNVAYSIFALIIMALSSKKLQLEYIGWFICYFVIAIGVTYLISAPRYLVACLPLYPAIVMATENKMADGILTIGCILSSLYYLFAFSARWEVF